MTKEINYKKNENRDCIRDTIRTLKDKLVRESIRIILIIPYNNSVVVLT